MKKQKAVLISCCVTFALATLGCNSETQVLMSDIPRSEYEKNRYETVVVEKGDMEPDFVLNVKTIDRERVVYSIDEGEYDVKKVYVAIGDHVEKGQLLMELDAKEIQDQVQSCSYDVHREELLLNYYTNLDAQDTSGKDKYKADVIKHTNALALAKLSLSEANEKLAHCSFTAEESGDIILINSSVTSGHVTAGTELMCEAFGEETYYAETKEEYEFKIGDEYTADSAFGIVPMTVIGVSKEGDKTRIEMVPSNHEAVVNGADSLSITIHKSKLNGVVFVSSKAVHELDDGRKYVYVMDKDGFTKVVFVETGDSIGNSLVIKSGLNGGEEVAIR